MIASEKSSSKVATPHPQTIGRAELAAELAPLLKISKSQARETVDAVLAAIVKHIRDNDRVELRGFATMQKKRIPARRRRNPAAANFLDQTRRERLGLPEAEPFVDVPAHDAVAVKVSPRFLGEKKPRKNGRKEVK